MQIKCTQCGADVTIQQDETFIECPFCTSALYLDKKKVVFHYLIHSNFKHNEAENNLKRWMSGNHTVKDLDLKSKIIKSEFYYFPVWYFKTKDSGGDKIYIQPAASTSVSEIKKLNIPAGALKFYDKNIHNDHEIIKPDVLLENAKQWLTDSGVNTGFISESALVHIPFYNFHYTYNGQTYAALVEASSGQVYANVYPAKSEAPFRVLFAMSITAFILAGIVSYVLGFVLTGEFEEAVIAAEIFKIISYTIIAVPLIIMAYIIAKKV